MKQIGLGFAQYTQDYDEKYPMAWWGTGFPQTNTSMPGGQLTSSDGANTGNWITWMDIIYPYVKSSQIYVCPSANRPTEINYGYSGAFSGWHRGIYIGTGSGPIALSQVNRPSDTFMLTEYNIIWGLYANPAEGAVWAGSPDPNTYRIMAPHLDGGNIAYADGHVKWWPRSKIAATASWSDPHWNAFIN